MNESNQREGEAAQDLGMASSEAALAAAEAKATENWNSYLRAVAEMENFRKRTEREIDNARKFAVERFAQELVTVGDALEAGISAGANCWFEQCSTDSWPGSLNVIPCLGIIKGSFCPHYDGEPGRRPTLQQFIAEGTIKPGYAADDGAAAHFIDGEVVGGVSSRPNAKLYRIFAGEGGVREEVVATRYLGA